jgi:hypothetical protein
LYIYLKKNNNLLKSERHESQNRHKKYAAVPYWACHRYFGLFLFPILLGAYSQEAEKSAIDNLLDWLLCGNFLSMRVFSV